MKKYLVVVAALFLGALSTIGVASPASAYPETSCDAQVTAQLVDSGALFTATGTSHQFTTGSRSARAAAFAAVHWKVTFNGVVRHPVGVSFKETFRAPTVTKRTVFTLTAEATMPDEKTTCKRSVAITVQPGGAVVSPPGGTLPGTGGPRLLILLAGVVLVGGGAVALRASRSKS